MTDVAAADPLEGLFAQPEPVIEGEVLPPVDPPAAEAPAPKETVEEPKQVPLAALEDERRKRQDAERELETLRKPAAAPEVDPLTSFIGTEPDPATDPAGFARHMAKVTQFNQLNMRLDFSEKFARNHHGDELVNEAFAWANKQGEDDPDFMAKLIWDADPYGKAVKEFQAVKEVESLRTLPDEVRNGLDDDELAWLREHRAKKSGAAPAVNDPPVARTPTGQFKPAPRSPAPPKPSLASDTAALRGGNSAVPVGDGVAFDSMFK